jgi:hypothetical protein
MAAVEPPERVHACGVVTLLGERMNRWIAGALALVLTSGAAAQYSGQHGCTQDCSGHNAGYAWAEHQDIQDPDDCDGDSQSFIEGCQDYAEARQQELQDQADESQRQAREDAGCDADDEDCDVD